MAPSLEVPSENPLAYCRLCFSTSPSKKIQLLREGQHWIEYIQRTVGIRMTIEADLPFAICIGCKTTLASVDKFRRTCRLRDTVLRQFRDAKLNNEVAESTSKVSPPEIPTEIITAGTSAGVTVDESEANSEDHDSDAPTIDIDRCMACEKDFSSTQAYKIHMRKIHGRTGKAAVNCPLCSKQFRNYSRFQRHILNHPDRQNKQMCRFCNQMFVPGEEMNQHEEDQHGLRFECRLCHKRFCSEKEKHIHKLMHLGGMGEGSKKKVTCKICFRVFPNRHCYNIHVKKHEKRFMCRICATNFPSVKVYLQHQTVVHQSRGTMDECVECREIFKDVQEFVDHLNLKHAEYDQDLANDELSESEDGDGLELIQNPEGEFEPGQSSQQQPESEQPKPETVNLVSSDDFPVYMDEEDDAMAAAVDEEQQTMEESITDRLEEELMLDEAPRDSGFDLYGTAFQPQNNSITLKEEVSE